MQLIYFNLFPLLFLFLFIELFHGEAEVTLYALLQILVPSLGLSDLVVEVLHVAGKLLLVRFFLL